MTCVHKVRWDVKRPENCRFRLSVSHYKDRIVAPEEYAGATVVTPSDSEQVLATKDKLVREDITVTGITGTQTITENGEYDVVGDKSVVVDVWPTEYSDDIDDFSGGNIRALISHAQEYINTEYYPRVCTEYFLKVTKDKQHGKFENFFASLFESTGTRIGIQMYLDSMTNVYYYATLTSGLMNIPSSLSADVPTILSTRHIVSADPYTIATKPLLIFHGYYGTGLDQKGQFNFFGLKCYDFGTLVKKYVPWLDDNGVPCVHELVDDEYFYNVGTGTFGYIDLEGNVHDT